MAITVRLYSFSKRKNSTKQPSASGTDFSCTMIEDTSLIKPTFKLSIAANPVGNNYAYVADFNRYYFITDISTHQNFWYITCVCDELGSYKSQIGAEEHYVLRSASDYDGNIIDGFYPAKAERLVTKYVSPGPYAPSPYAPTGYSFVVGVVGFQPFTSQDGCQFGSVVYYHMNEDALFNFLTYLMSNMTGATGWGGIDDLEYSPGVQKALINPIQYIVSCMYLPYPPPSWTPGQIGNIGVIKCGYYDIPISGNNAVCFILSTQNATSALLPIEKVVLDLEGEMPIPKHPQAATRGAYLNGSPFNKFIFHYEPFGDIELDANELIDTDDIEYKISIDMIKGNARMLITSKQYPNRILYSGNSNMGVDIVLSQALKDQLAQNTLGFKGLANVLQSGYNQNFGGAYNTFIDTITDGIRLEYPTINSIGSGGSYLSLFCSDQLYLLHIYQRIVDENLPEVGRPLCQRKILNTLSGFICCDKADVSFACLAEEAENINNYLNTGFFYE